MTDFEDYKMNIEELQSLIEKVKQAKTRDEYEVAVTNKETIAELYLEDIVLEIKQLRERVAELEDALRPFARQYRDYLWTPEELNESQDVTMFIKRAYRVWNKGQS